MDEKLWQLRGEIFDTRWRETPCRFVRLRAPNMDVKCELRIVV